MATSAVEVCNIALARIGVVEFIGSLAESTVPAQVCNVLYGPALKGLLAGHQWRFATYRDTLALLTDGERDGWAYAYALPSRCLTPMRLWAGTRNPSSGQKIPYAIEGSDAGRVLLTDAEDASLTYTKHVEDVRLLPEQFCDALSWRLAVDLALAIPGKAGLSKQLSAYYMFALTSAAKADAEQEHGDLPPESEVFTSR